MFFDVPSLKLTAKAPKIEWFPSSESPFPGVFPLFSGAFAVSFREGTRHFSLNHPLIRPYFLRETWHWGCI